MADENGFQRLFAVGDVHGEFHLLRHLIEAEIRFDPDADGLVFLGDYIDRGPLSKDVVRYVSQLKEQYGTRVVLLKGNHEELAEEALSGGSPVDLRLWMLNGGGNTVSDFGSLDEAGRVLLPFIGVLELYYETDSHVFVHAGLERGRPPGETSPDVLLWTREFAPHFQGKTVVSGHTPHREVTFYDGVVIVDSGAVYGGALSAYDVLNKTVFTAHRRDLL